ncbi:hypothetical protein D3C84_382730 [compost metagenome]
MSRVEIDVFECVEAQALLRHGTGHDVDQVLALTQLRQGCAVHHGLGRQRHVGRREAKRARLVLIELHFQRAHRVVPVELEVAHLRVGPNHLLHVAGNLAHHLGIGTYDAELHRVADRRPQLEAGHAHPRLRELLVSRGHQPLTYPFTCIQVLGHYNELGESRIRQLGVEREIEARCAGAGVGGIETHVLVLRQDLLHALDLLGRRGERGAFLDAQVNDQFRTRTVGEELLRH